MSDDEADLELLELLRKSLGISSAQTGLPSETRVLQDAEYVYNNSIDVSISRNGTITAAALLWDQMRQRNYDTSAWSKHELHPKAQDEATVNFIFTMDLLNFSFWSELPDDRRFSVTYRGKRWTGYWSLVACLQRALEEGNFRRLLMHLHISFSWKLEKPLWHPTAILWLTCGQAFLSHHPHFGCSKTMTTPESMVIARGKVTIGSTMRYLNHLRVL